VLAGPFSVPRAGAGDGFTVPRSLAHTFRVSGPSVSLTGRNACQSRPLAASSASIAVRSWPTRPRLETATVLKKRNSSPGAGPWRHRRVPDWRC
jgi:hypothetical protein